MSGEHLEVNRKLWDEWSVIHERSLFYGVETFKDGRNTLSAHEMPEIGDVDGKSLIHLMCHIGLDTMTLSRMGAHATGVDFSPRSIEIGKGLAQELGLSTVFVECNVYDTLNEFEGEKFDFVYTSHGILAWLSDIRTWGRIVAGLLKPGGTFYMSEIHPFSITLEAGQDAPEVRYRYFHSGATQYATEGSYAERNADVETSNNFQWQHTLADVVCALIDAGLVIEFVHEWPFAVYEQMPGMVQDPSDLMWRLPNAELPFLFSLRAHLPLEA